MQNPSRFNKRISTWKTAYADETHGVFSTLQTLYWNYATFRTAINLVRQGQAQPEKFSPNRLLFDMVRESFWERTLLGVRRLLDTADLSGDKGVYSLRAVIKDVEACQGSINRHAFVEEIAGTVYDYEAVEAAEYTELKRLPPGTARWGSTAAMLSRQRHEQFDFLSGKDHGGRSPKDRIRPEVFEKLRARLASLDDIVKHVSTHIAHSGNSQSRAGKSLGDFDIRDARSALKQLTEVAQLTGMWFAYDGGAGLATPMYNQFEGLDRPLTDENGLIKLQEDWNEIDRDISEWLQTPSDVLEEWCPAPVHIN